MVITASNGTNVPLQLTVVDSTGAGHPATLPANTTNYQLTVTANSGTTRTGRITGNGAKCVDDAIPP